MLVSFTGRDVSGITKNVEKIMIDVCRLLDSLGLELSCSKSKFLVFSKNDSWRNKNGDSWRIKVDNTYISSSNVVKFLGMYFRSSLRWSFHINELVKKCLNASKVIKCLRKTWWGADPILLLRIYRALVRSTIEYGAFLFYNLTRSDLQKLNKIQLQNIKAALGYSASTPNNVVLYEAKEPPLDLRFRYLTCNFLSRSISKCDYRLLDCIQDIIEFEDNPVIINREGNINLIACFREIEKYSHLIKSSNKPVCYEFEYDNIFFHPIVSFEEGIVI